MLSLLYKTYFLISIGSDAYACIIGLGLSVGISRRDYSAADKKSAL